MHQITFRIHGILCALTGRNKESVDITFQSIQNAAKKILYPESCLLEDIDLKVGLVVYLPGDGMCEFTYPINPNFVLAVPAE